MGNLIQPINLYDIDRDEYGFWHHPDLPIFEEGDNNTQLKW